VSEFTLGGYMAAHERAAAFAGSDGEAYSVDLLIDEEPGPRGQFGGALLFIRWAPDGTAPVGHLESGYLVWGRTPDEARERVGALSLYDVKALLDELIATGRPEDF
jgi:hypothetical protein